jgi:hypothetical protein
VRVTAALQLYHWEFSCEEDVGGEAGTRTAHERVDVKGDAGAQMENNSGNTSKMIRVSLVLMLCIGLFIWGEWPLGTVAQSPCPVFPEIFQWPIPRRLFIPSMQMLREDVRQIITETDQPVL